MPAPVKRCAIYTRKSSEEGLEQSFNSLHAQREACLAYIESQRHEGWRALDTAYDDGGYSGGSMERPGVQALLKDIGEGKVDVVVVYKVDRLTRSLADFAKIVELFDKHSVSFVSVTQHFNTSSSMGRLTLNVLLSFAQFEREVTGERIRDKIAASKKKGMWMGGQVPLGYDLHERKLTPNADEAALVRRIFDQYLARGCVRKLQQELKTSGVLSKVRMSRGGRKSGGQLYSRGALYSILQNRLYLGEIAHRGAVYPGQHEPIISREIWDLVQTALQTNSNSRKAGVDAKSPSLLAGFLFDEEGHRFTPLHSTKKGKRYRYYTSQAVIRNGPARDKPARIPAHDIEKLVLDRLRQFLKDGPRLLEAVGAAEAAGAQQTVLRKAAEHAGTLIKSRVEARAFLITVAPRIVLRRTEVEIQLDPLRVRQVLGLRPQSDSTGAMDPVSLSFKADIKRLGGAVRFVVLPEQTKDDLPQPNDVLIKAIARGRRWYEMLVSGEVSSLQALAKRTGLHERYVGRVMRCAFVSPRLVQEILEGRQPRALTLDALFRGIPCSWSEQQRVFARYTT